MSRGHALNQPHTPLPKAIIEEAASWLVRVEECRLSKPEQAQLDTWRSQSPQHEQAWQAALQFKGLIGSVPACVGNSVLGRQYRTDRRTVLKSIAGLAMAAPAGWIAWEQWPSLSADYRTRAGAQRQIDLPDGSRLMLNTATLVDIRFSDAERLVRLLEGEIDVTTAADPFLNKRPFIVQTGAGRVYALGTRFTVRDMGDGRIRVSVYEHAAAIQPALSGSETIVEAGQASVFDRQQATSPAPHHYQVPPWTRGQLISDNQRLDAFLAELGRYRPGILRCDPAVAELHISGVFQLKDTDQVLDVIASTLPVRVNRVTNYWVTVTRQ